MNPTKIVGEQKENNMKNKNNTDKLREEFELGIVEVADWFGTDKKVKDYIRKFIDQAHQAGYQEAVEKMKRNMPTEFSLFDDDEWRDSDLDRGLYYKEMRFRVRNKTIREVNRFLTTLTKNEK